MQIPQLEKVLQQIKKGKDIRLFLIHGDEEYLVQQAKLGLIREFVAPGEEEFGLIKVSLEKMNCLELLDILRSPSLFASERCYDLTDTPYFKSNLQDKGLDRLIDYLKGSYAQESRIIFSAGSKIEKRSRFYRVMKDCGAILEFPGFDIYKAGQINKDGMYPYVKSYLSTANKNIEPDAFKELRVRKENNLFSIIQELDKLIAYSGTKSTITISDVETLVPLARSDQIFMLVDAILERDLHSGMALMEELIARGTPPTHVIQLMARQYRTLLQAQQLLAKSPESLQTGQFAYINFRDRILPVLKTNYSREIEAGYFPLLNNHPYVIFKHMTACKLFDETQLKEGLIILKEIDTRIKSTGNLPQHLMREMIFLMNFRTGSI